MPRVRPRRTLRGRHTPFASRLSDALRPGPLPHPERFDPDRFLDKLPDTYEWIPFGGGVRRCIGATFAHMEMDVVLRVLLERTELLSTDEPDEPWVIRGIVLAAGQGGRAAVRRRVPAGGVAAQL